LFSALAPDGSLVDGFVFDGPAVTWAGTRPVDAGIRYELELPATADPQWLVPGVFYGENRPAACTRIYPRFTPGRVDVARMESDSWSFRADRCATPAVFARGGGLVTSERSPLGQSGVGFAYRGGRPAIWLDFPYREEPLRYDGSETPVPPDVQTYRWSPGESVTLDVRRNDGDWRSELRPAAGPAELESLEAAAELAAYGLYRWHYLDDPPRLVETRSFDGGEVRDAMHVSWVSGAPYAYALLRHGRRVGNAEYVRAAESVLDHIAANLAPSGTFWPQWTHDCGWTWGWHPDHSRAHARTLADATLFMLRAGRVDAARSNLAVALRTQRADGALPAAHRLETGEAASWEGTAGMAWIPPLVEAGELEAARRAGEYYEQFDVWFGAPEDVDLAPTSEDGYSAVAAFVAVENWDTARRAADWTLTFRYTYDVDFGVDTTLGRLGFRSRGADQASPANQHLHAFGLVCLPEMLRLGEPYRTSALQNLSCCLQPVGAPRGMVPERLYQTDCFGRKGELDPLSHAWSIGVVLLACEELLA
jgi:hypothetical protein